MVSPDVKAAKRITQPVLGMMLLSLFVVAVPADPSVAQGGRSPSRVGSACPPLEPYTLGAGDRIQLEVFNVPEYSREYQVLADGTVNLPVVGVVSVRGLTLVQAAGRIKTQYAPYLQRPIITVGLTGPRPVNIAISGEVLRPGSYSIPITVAGGGGTGGGGIQLPTLTQAITLAGGISQAADLRRVQVIRLQTGRINLNLLALVQRAEQCQNITLRDGDSIIIPTTSGINLAEAPQKATASFAPTTIQPLNVVVVGEVTRPGPQVVQPDQSGAQPTVSRALQVAGGIRQSADIRRIQVRRPTSGGGWQSVTVNLSALLQYGDRTQDLILQQGDTIVVPPSSNLNPTQALNLAAASFSPATNQPLNIVVVGEVTRPGPYIVQPDQTGAQPTITRALQVAGGIRQTSDISRIQIIRFTREGTQQTITANLSQLLQNGDRSQDIILQQGDTVVVPIAERVSPAESLALASTSFSPTGAQPLNVAIAGEVQRPGTYVIQPAQPPTVVVGALPTVAGLPTVTQALQLAGGITQSADVRRVEVRRVTQDGSQQVITLNFWQLLVSGDRSQDLVLQQGDTIFVPTAAAIDSAEASLLASASFSPASIPVNVVGEVVRPGVVQVPPNAALNQAILAAGGFNVRAKKNRVELLRLNPNGTVSRWPLAIDLDQGVNEQSNPPLRPNDVILVARSGLARTGDNLGLILNPINQGFSVFNFWSILRSVFGSN